MRSFVALLFPLILSVLSSARAQISQTVLLETSVGGLLKVHASVAGHEGLFLFDSGSGFTSVSPEFATAIGCHPWGQITGFRMTGERLDMKRCDDVGFSIAGKSLPAGTVGVLDLSKYLPPEIGHIDGTIALDLFANQAFTLSYANHALLILDRPALARQTKGLRPMPVHIVRDAEGMALTVNLPVVTPAGTAWFEMDSGNTSDLVLVNKPLAALFRLNTDAKDDANVNLKLLDGTNFVGKARVLDLILDGNLGTSFLSTHDVTVDLAQGVAWIRASVPVR